MNRHHYLIDLLNANKYLQAALHHRSAKHQSIDFLPDNSKDTSILEAWSVFGKGIIDLYASRLTLNDKKINSVATCSITSKILKKQLIYQFSLLIRDSKMAIFGPGVSNEEKEDVNYYHEISYQIIGAFSHRNSLEITFSKLLNKLLDGSKITVSAEKDSKTILQEYSQGRFKTAPKYKILKTSGPEHNQIFEVEINLMGKISIGLGRSRKLAEKNAAEVFISKYNIPKGKPSILDLSSLLDINEIKVEKNTYEYCDIGNFLKKLNIPERHAGIIILAMKHRSSQLSISDGKLGNNNGLLAFIGSYVLVCLAQQNIIRKMSSMEIKKNGGLAPITAKTTTVDSIEKHYNTLAISDIAILGNGERSPHKNLKAEFFQAVCGAFYLIDELEKKESSPSKNTLSIISNLIEIDINEINKINEDPLFSKRLLQERCQAIGLKITYNTFTKNNEKEYGKVKKISSIKIESENKSDVLYIERENLVSLKGAMPKQAVFEAELAKELKIYFDVLFGETKRTNLKNSERMTNLKAIEWIWDEVENILENFKDSKNFKQKQRILKSNFLGLSYLRENNFNLFEQWFYELSEIYSNIYKNSLTKNISSFYKSASHSKQTIIMKNLLNSSLLELEEELTKADPLDNSLDFRKNKAFISLVNNATALKLKGEKPEKTTLSEILCEFRILNRKTKNDAVLILEDTEDEIVEIKGTTLTLINILINSSHDGKVIIKKKNNLLVFSIRQTTESFIEDRKSDPIWVALMDLLPIVNIEDNGGLTDIHTAGLNYNKKRELCLALWFDYISQGEKEINDMIALMLHNVKNDILGFTYSSAHAIKETHIKTKYQLASEASSHTEQALSRLKGIRNILKDTKPLKIEPIRLDLFMKSLISDIWSWAPNSITLSFPPNNTTDLIWTSTDNLKSIIINIVKNAIEAMDGKGNIEIEYIVDPNLFNILFSVTDTGPGFSSSQISSLNAGIPITSSKRDGQGIGLLTVILLVKELTGTMNFSNNKSNGGRVEVWIPSLPNETLEENEND
ncbi:hypothetical protein JY476_19205 [Serratia marcescens]|nr:hypothetical protein [Serratia marcescens]